jgi:phosphoadenylyl-sulfate reductase (thioredoxin)
VSAPAADRAGLASLAADLEGKPPAEILAAAAGLHPGRIALACSFGPEDCLLVDVIGRTGLLVDVFTLDTGYLFPETYTLWRELEDRYRLRIDPAPGGPPTHDAADPAVTPPWQVDADACCDARKVRPLRAKLATLGDQTPERAGAKVIEWDARFGLVKVNPLAAWTSAQVWAALEAGGVPTNPLHQRGYPSIGCAPCTSPVAPGEDPRAGRWRGSEKKECGLHWPRK